MFRIRELAAWLGISVLETVIHLVGIFLYYTLFSKRRQADKRGEILDPEEDSSQYFLGDAACAVASLIVAFRLRQKTEDRFEANRQFIWSIIILEAVYCLKMFLCFIMVEAYAMNYKMICMPLFVLFQWMVLRRNFGIEEAVEEAQ